MEEKFTNMLIATIFLTGVGYIVVTKWLDFRTAPLILGKKKPGEAGQEVTIHIPEMWIPWQPGDTKESVVQRFKPDVSVEGGEWVIQFQPIRSKIGGIISEYTPKPIKTPLIPDMDTLVFAAKIVPKVTPTISPIGWTIKFPKFTLLY